ncbi:MAG TPA: hypothetical protein VK104_09305 [Burkholderiaceae bacterium]|nr:hypothetical protein [Burkholderiaceae bacterium]
MSYSVLLTLHLIAATLFVGTVFFEVIILEGIRPHVPRDTMRLLERAIGKRARRIMPWVLLVLYAAGISMAWHYRHLLSHPLGSGFSLLLTLKIILATSVFAHFATAMIMHARHRLRSVHFKWIHISVFIHVLLIVFLAKAMFY